MLMQLKDAAARKRFKLVKLVWLLIVSATLLGCSDSQNRALNSIKDLNRNSIQKLTTCYTMFYTFKNTKGPKSEQELKDFISQDPNIDLQLERIDLEREDFESCFQGADGEAMKVFYGVPAPTGPDREQPIVFEKVSEGNYRVGFSDGVTKEVQEDEYNRLLKLANGK